MNPGTATAPLPQQEVRVVECNGSPYEMGHAQGAALRENIHQALLAVADLEAFRLLAPLYLPFAWFRRLAEAKSSRFLKWAFRNSRSGADDRLRGIADGAGVPVHKLALCCVIEAVLSDLSPLVTAGPNGLEAGCSAVAVTGSASADGLAIIAHNFDYLPMVQPFYCLRRSRPADGLSSIDFIMSPLSGTIDGINETGLAITCNYAYVIDQMVPAPTVTMVVADTLAHSRTIDEACEFVRGQPRAGGGLLMLADAEGTIASLEVSNTRVERRDPPPGTDQLWHTNRIICRAMMGIELPEDAHHGCRAPQALRGRRVHQSADCRAAAIERQLQQTVPLTPDDLHRIMSDHGDGPNSDTVCMHGSYWHTTACTQLLPADRTLRASFSSACTAEFVDVPV